MDKEKLRAVSIEYIGICDKCKKRKEIKDYVFLNSYESLCRECLIEELKPPDTLPISSQCSGSETDQC